MSSPGGAEVGRVSVKVVPDTSRFRRELERELKEKDYQLDQANKIVEETKGKTILEIDMMIDSKNKEKD